MTALAALSPVSIQMLALCHATAEAAPIPEAVVDGIHHIVRYANPAFCALVGRRREDLLGHPFASIESAGDQCLALLNRVHRTGTSETHIGESNTQIGNSETETPDTHPGRQSTAEHPVFHSYAMWPALGSNGHPLGIVIRVSESAAGRRDAVAMNQALMLGSVRQHELAEEADRLNLQLKSEISLNQQAQEVLIRSEKLASVGRMAAVMAHEINNPLDAVMNTLFLLEGTENLPTDAQEYLKTAQGELKRIAHITRQTLGFYRESSEASTFLVAPLLDSILDLLQAKVESKHAIIERRCDSQLMITGNFGELRQVFSNLLLNSLDAIRECGTVHLRAFASSSRGHASLRTRITIADNGRGIDRATLPRIFEPFFTTKGAIGNGLGLWVSRQIIKNHKGSILVRSSATGSRRGTVFTVVLPADPAPSAAAA
jgi:two-component system NtrC family sensor kinase